MDEKTIKKEPKNEFKHSPPIKKNNIKINNKNININNLKTNGELSDQTIKQSFSRDEIINKKNDIIKMKDETIINDKIINIDTRIMKNNEYELNNLQYKEAIEEDKRTFIQYYFALLKTKHLLMFSFFL